MDTILTLEGRRQLSDGEMKIKYVSFTDGTTFYRADAETGSEDVTNRTYLEQCHLPQDQITFEADDTGRIKPFKNKNGIQAVGGKIINKTLTAATISQPATEQIEVLVGNEFTSTANSLLGSSVENFKNLYTIGTNDPLFLEDEFFEIHPPSHEFTATNFHPLPFSDHTKVIGNLPGLIADKLLSNVINFQYLPPINQIQDNSIDKKDQLQFSSFEIGDYAKFNPQDDYSPEDIEIELQDLEQKGFKKSFKFDPTSIKNMMVSQVFELSNDELKKLDVIEYGTYKYEGNLKQIFFVGKVLTDDYGANTFVRLFTLAFE
jgi:hypothetical protein